MRPNIEQTHVSEIRPVVEIFSEHKRIHQTLVEGVWLEMVDTVPKSLE
jgi:hypothetical protein